ncbi:MAG: inorganic diphosphatase [Acidobacteriaceae bacterium]|nr:inorganic diphosphatase [Acidobacteriaceae bacterium]
MADIEQLPNQFDAKKHTCKAVIESPKGRRSKFKYQPDSGLFSLSKVLPQGFTFPVDFGFIPSTKGDDDDPLDVIVLMDEPTHVGCLVDVRLIGVIKVVQTEGGKQVRNDRLLAVAGPSIEYADTNSIQDLPKSFLEQLSEFIGLYNKNTEKRDSVEGVEGADAAVRLLQNAMKRFRS